MRNNLTGQRFSRLTAIARNGYMYGVQTAWLCRCDCGGEVTVPTTALKAGGKRSCGCLEAENNASLYRHGHYGTRTYRIWNNMLSRCRNPNVKAYADYGGRGITVCKEWLEFANFYADMGDAPAGMTIDRGDNDLGYWKANCHWRSMKEQSNNRRNNLKITHQGRTQTLKQWTEELGLKYPTAYWRFKHGHPVDHVLGA